MSLHGKIYKTCKNDKVFVEEFTTIKGNSFPFWPSEIEKGMFCTAYLGWLVGKYGSVEGERRYTEIKHS